MNGNEATSRNIADGKKFIEEVVADSNSVSVMTINTIRFNGVDLTASWESDGLKIPMAIFDGVDKRVFYMRIPRDEVIKMFKDINEQLSHT